MNYIKKLKLLLLIMAIILVKSSYSQELDLEKKVISEVIKVEANSILTDTINFGILKNPHNDINTTLQTKALIFLRIKDEFKPQLHLWYFYDQNLNEPKGLLYNWGLFNPSFNPSKNRDLLESLTKQEDEFTKKFEEQKTLISDLLGEPSEVRIIEDSKSKLVKQVLWISNEKIVQLSIEFMRELNEIPGIGILGDFHIQIMTTYR
uniref:hypothetical protein n=1 Tax=Fulvivirga sp. TaxID=1931237 RepID=UPI0040495E6B